jgi:hypothetical protein
MKKKSLALLTTTTFLATLGLTVQTPAQTIQDQITTFDPPGSYSTGPTSINPSGEIAGYYFGPTGPTAHGFVRDKDGTIISFDAGPGLTVPTSINPRGTITDLMWTRASCHTASRAIKMAQSLRSTRTLSTLTTSVLQASIRVVRSRVPSLL